LPNVIMSREKTAVDEQQQQRGIRNAEDGVSESERKSLMQGIAYHKSTGLGFARSPECGSLLEAFFFRWKNVCFAQ
jgi:hypothetical protein